MSRRRKVFVLVLSVGVAAPALLAAVLFGIDGSWGAAALSVGVSVAGLLLGDGWRRQAQTQHLARLAAERQREMTALLVTLVGSEGVDSDAASVRNSVLGRVEASERRVLDALSALEMRLAQGTPSAGMDTGDPAR